MKQPRHEKSGLDATSPNNRIETADPASSKKKDHVNSTRHFSAMPGREKLDELVVLQEVFDVHHRAERLLLSADPLAVELYQLGYRACHHEKRQAVILDQATSGFLGFLAEDPEATPRSLPPLENDWRIQA